MNATEVLIETPLIHPLSDPVMAPRIPAEIKASQCPWGRVKTIEAVSFNDVMSEQLAKSLDEEENKNSATDDVCFVDDTIVCDKDVNDCSDDFLLAKMLQLEFDKEHDQILNKEESKYNGGSKVKISYGKYRRLPENSLSSDDDSDDKEFQLEQHAKNHYRNIDEAERVYREVTKNGVSKKGGTTTTKHDLTISGRRNAGKLLEFPTCISTGDSGQFDMKISNHVYNGLRNYSNSENKRRHKVRDEGDKATAEKALDEKTHLILYRLINKSILDSLTGCISTGKEACVYHAWSAMPEGEAPSPEFALKVFKTTMNEFQNRDQYINEDYRFRYRFSKQNPRKVIHMWAEKEMRNLLRMNEAKISCPTVVILKKHVLVMSFIGKDMLPAPKIKDVDLSFADMTIMYEQVLEIMKGMYQKCKLVHADLSEYNLLWHDGMTYVIDVSQAVDLSHPSAMSFLLRDCTNISTFFERKGVLNVPSPENLFFEVCGKHLKSDDLLLN